MTVPYKPNLLTSSSQIFLPMNSAIRLSSGSSLDLRKSVSDSTRLSFSSPISRQSVESEMIVKKLSANSKRLSTLTEDESPDRSSSKSSLQFCKEQNSVRSPSKAKGSWANFKLFDRKNSNQL